MPVLRSGFERALKGFSITEFEDDHSVVFGMNPAYELAYLNPAWFEFARANQGEPAISREWGLGRCVLDSVPTVLLAFYQQAFDRCMASGRPWEHDYECSSDEIYRLFHLILYPLPNRRGLLAVHSLAGETTQAAVGREQRVSNLDAYVDDDGVIHQCFHCRRVQHATNTQRWDWVPACLRERPAKVSHSLCPTCLDFHYPESPGGYAPPDTA